MSHPPKEGQEIRLKGFPICPGLSIGKPFFFFNLEEKIPEIALREHEIESEVERYHRALTNSQQDVISLQARLSKEGSGEAVNILGSHLEMMKDPLVTVKIEEEIRAKGKNTEYIFKSVMGEYEKKFSSKISDRFFQERLKDFQDISRRIISHLREKSSVSLGKITQKVVVFANELSPSDTAEANTDFIEAFVTRSGAETSHVAIMARAKGIPFVSNVDFPDLSVSLPPLVIVDGELGEVIINPTSATLAHFKEKKKALRIKEKALEKRSELKAETLDGHKVRLSANVEMFNELDSLERLGSEGIGLFRSEYLFLAKDSFPSEEDQFLVYKSIVEKVAEHPSVIRTFDIGGDKFGSFHPTRYEKNPYLGCRAIRLMLKEKTAFKTQIKAILKASAFGEVSILFPMISGLTELREAKALVEEVKMELTEQMIPFSHSIAIGCMIEVPSAAVTADILARECDFLSIGTNDLVQYSLAVDRGNPAMSYLYTPTHPSILRLIKMVVDEGNRSKTPVSICGEIAADPKFTALLLGLGVHELSVSAAALPVVKDAIRSISIVEAVEFAEEALSLSTAEEIQELLERAYFRSQTA